MSASKIGQLVVATMTTAWLRILGARATRRETWREERSVTTKMPMTRFALIAVALAVSITGCSTAPAEGPKVPDVRGVWIGDWSFEPASAGRGMFTMTLTQDGTDVAGAIQLTGLDRRSPTPVRGTVRGDEIHLQGMPSAGVLKVTGNEMTGVVQRDGQSARVVARRQTD
jgi:hypothetical protein